MNALICEVLDSQQRSKSTNVILPHQSSGGDLSHNFYSFDAESSKTFDLFTSPKRQKPVILKPNHINVEEVGD